MMSLEDANDEMPYLFVLHHGLKTIIIITQQCLKWFAILVFSVVLC